MTQSNMDTEFALIEEYRRVLNDNPPRMAMRHLTEKERMAKMREAIAARRPLTTNDFIPKGAVT